MVGFQKEADKGAPDGYAPLDSDGKVPLANMNPGVGGDPAWGDVTGTLTNQVDLSDALDSKEATGVAADCVADHSAAADPHPNYALDSDLSAHVAAPDPHTAYALDSDLASHVGAADPHTGYQRESEKAAANGYASLDASTLVPVAQIPALSYEAAGAVAAHAGAADPHAGYQKESEKSAANGYASLGAATKVPTAELGGAGADSTKFLRGDQTWAAPPAGSGITTYATGSQTVATGNFLLLVKRMSLTTTQRYTGQGTSRLRIT